MFRIIWEKKVWFPLSELNVYRLNTSSNINKYSLGLNFRESYIYIRLDRFGYILFKKLNHFLQFIWVFTHPSFVWDWNEIDQNSNTLVKISIYHTENDQKTKFVIKDSKTKKLDEKAHATFFVLNSFTAEQAVGFPKWLFIS